MVVFRGTQSLHDIVVDLSAHDEEIDLPAIGQDHGTETFRVHGGILRAARRLIHPSYSPLFAKLKAALEENEGYSLILTGHSLGAACVSQDVVRRIYVASLLIFTFWNSFRVCRPLQSRSCWLNSDRPILLTLKEDFGRLHPPAAFHPVDRSELSPLPIQRRWTLSFAHDVTSAIFRWCSPSLWEPTSFLG